MLTILFYKPAFLLKINLFLPFLTISGATDQQNILNPLSLIREVEYQHIDTINLFIIDKEENSSFICFGQKYFCCMLEPS